MSPTAHLAFAIDAGYLPWCGVAALTAVEQTPERDLQIHVLHDGSLTGHPGASDLIHLVERAGAGGVTLHALDDDRVSRLPAMDRFGKTVWLRFLLPELLADVDRVLYLDADTFVASSLDPLLATDLGGRPLGAVTNVVAEEERPRLVELGLDDGAFFNSGVLLLDLERQRRDGEVDRLLETADRDRDRLLWPDQDALNLVFRDRWHALHLSLIHI